VERYVGNRRGEREHRIARAAQDRRFVFVRSSSGVPALFRRSRSDLGSLRGEYRTETAHRVATGLAARDEPAVAVVRDDIPPRAETLIAAFAQRLAQINFSDGVGRVRFEDRRTSVGFVIGGGIESMSRVPMGSDGGAIFEPQTQWEVGSVPQGVSADLRDPTQYYLAATSFDVIVAAAASATLRGSLAPAPSVVEPGSTFGLSNGD